MWSVNESVDTDAGMVMVLVYLFFTCLAFAMIYQYWKCTVSNARRVVCEELEEMVVNSEARDEKDLIKQK